MFNLEDFPTSPAAKRMIKTVSPIYDKSYVGKWLFQVMGLEMDEAWKFLEELRLQAFPETATWGIVYWEQRYHIPPDDSLTIEERRQRVIIKRGKRRPMNPARIEQFTRDVSGRQTVVTEHNEDYVFFVAILPGEAEVDYHELIKTIRSVKPSHLSPVVLFETKVGLIIQADSQKAYPFGYTLAGTVPDVNTVGALRRESFILAADMEGHPLNYPMTGVSKAGEIPDTNMVGAIRRESFILDVDVKDHPYEYEISGTGKTGETPDTNIVGALNRSTLTLYPEMDGHKYVYPKTGTKPHIATIGALGRNTFILEAEVERHRHEYPTAGTGAAGEEPDTNMAGGISRNELTIEAEIDGYKHDYRIAGTVPDTNTISALRRESLVLAADMEGHLLNYPVAGIKPDTNTAGKAESGSVLPIISAESSVFDYQLCGEPDDEV